MIFYKYHGAGNDFILIDNRELQIQLTNSTIAALCRRNFGIGADGFISIEKHNEADFYMSYYNSDGAIGSMCGNGGRCAVLFAYQLGIIEGNDASFYASDGLHAAKVLENDIVALKMNVSPKRQIVGNAYVIDSGSPHYVRFVYNVDNMNVKKEGRIVRNSAQFKQDGINVNFVEEQGPNSLFVRTYERGVENETLSCGTGVTASAIAQFYKNKLKNHQNFTIKTLGGKLQVQLEADGEDINSIWLVGPAKEVFIGEVDTESF